MRTIEPASPARFVRRNTWLIVEGSRLRAPLLRREFELSLPNGILMRSIFLLAVAVFVVGQLSAQSNKFPPHVDTNAGATTKPHVPPEKAGNPGAVVPIPTKPAVDPNAPAGKLGCAKPTYDFGEAGQNEEIIHDFEIENIGKGDLVILSATGSCGCTAVAPPDKKPLKPGEKTKINVSLKTLTNQGPLSKPVTVATNDPITPSFVLTISGKVTQPFRPAVTELNFGSLRKGEAVEPKSFEILTNGTQSITDIKVDNEQVKASFEQLPAAENRQGYKITVRIDGPLPVGQLRALMSVGTTVASQKLITIPVLALIDGEIAVKPRTFNFGKIKKGDTTTKTVEIEKAGAADLKIESITVKPEGAFTAKLETVTEGKSYKIVLGVAPEAKAEYSRGTVMIKTNCPGETDLQVYFYALVQN